MGHKIESVEEEVMKEVAQELGIKLSVVRDMVINGQSKFTAKVISSGTWDSVRWPRLGIFKVKPKHVQATMYKRGMNKYQKKIFEMEVRLGLWKPPAETEPNNQ